MLSCAFSSAPKTMGIFLPVLLIAVIAANVFVYYKFVIKGRK